MAPKPGYKLSTIARQHQSEGIRRYWREWLVQKSPPPTHKRCNKCGETKPLDEFTTKRRILKSTGEYTYDRMSRCKLCENQRTNAWYHSLSAEETKELQLRQRAARDPDKQREYARDYQRRKRGQPIVDPAIERMPYVDPAPFVKWWISLNGDRPSDEVLGGKLSRVVNRMTFEGQKRVRLDTIYDLCTAVDRPEMAKVLYPDF